MKPLIIFRADASLNLGTGHIIRCLNLAVSLKEQGADIHFVCKKYTGNLFDLIRQHHIAIHELPTNDDNKEDNIWQLDAKGTIDYIKQLSRLADWVIVDHYELDQKWEENIRAFTF